MAFFGLFAILSTTAPAQEPARFALLIGNQGYSRDVGPLKNTHQDIEVVGTALKKLGFEIVSLPDADYREMDIAIRRHVRQVRNAGPGAVSFVYYSGHGIANPNTGNNYLVPVDVAKADTDNIWDESFEQSVLIDRLNRQAPQAIHFVVLDACRNELNLTSSGTKALGAEKGFRPVRDVRGMLIAYATAERQTAADTGDFARILAEEIVRPGSEAVSAFRRVQLRVEQTLGQEPWMSLRYLPETYLAGKETAPPPAPASQTEPPLSEAAQAWRAIQDTRSEAVLERFIREFPGSVYAGFAEARLEELRNQQVAVGIPEQPAAAQTQPACDGVEVSLGTGGTQCVKPGSGASFKDCAECPEMVVAPKGSFMMGSPDDEEGRSNNEGPRREVTIAQPFAVGKFEVTFAEWDACVSDGGCKRKPEDSWGRGNQPVMRVSWDDITTDYLPWLSRNTGKSYRLLTEAEWEYAARAGTTGPFSFDLPITPEKANYDGNYTYGSGKKGEYRKKTVPVKSFDANPWGLYQVHGNVWEWVQDCYADIYKDAPRDGSAAKETSGCARVLRGGSWFNYPQFLRSADRFRSSPDFRFYGFGFRVARTLSPP